MERIPTKSDDLSEWYQAVCYQAEFVSQSPVRGCMVMRPYGFALWEHMQAELDRRFKATGHENAYFPLLIPESFLTRRPSTSRASRPRWPGSPTAASEELAEPLAIRPTSEAIIGTCTPSGSSRYRDLPMLINQWANVMRWEKATAPLPAHGGVPLAGGPHRPRHVRGGARRTMQMLDVYRDFVEDDLAIPVVPGREARARSSPAPSDTYSIEALMGDGKALQSGTSHNLGDNFARAFDIKFLDRDGAAQARLHHLAGACPRA